MKVKKIIIATFTLLLSAGCFGQNEKGTSTLSETSPKQQAYDYSTIQIIDRFHNTLRPGKWSNLFKHNEEQFAPVYVGDIRAAIQLIYKPERTGNRMVWDWEKDRYKDASDSSLRLTIDTSRIIGMPMSIWEYYKKTEFRREFMAYPVFLENISNDTLNIGFGDVFPISIEAKDKEGNWRRILRPFERECGTDLKLIFLAPHQIAITAMPLCEGSFFTELRLVFKVRENKLIYSNIIKGYTDDL